MDLKLDNRKIEKICKALGDPHRIKIIEAIKNEKDWMQCSSIVDMFNIAQSTVSHHVNQLLDADLLLMEKEGRTAKYRINKDMFTNYTKYLRDFEA